MVRVPDDELERLKREVSVQRLAEGADVQLKKHGKDLMGLCPFHEDREPSLVISPEKNLWHCLGACQAGGSVIDWVMRAQGVSFRHAAELLREDIPSLAAKKPLDAARIVKHSSVRKLDDFAEPEEPDAVMLQRVADYYHATLKQQPDALGYLRERGLVHGEVVDHFKLGYSNRTLGYRLPDKNRQAGAALRGQLQRLGVIRQSGHEHLNRSLVIPIFGEHGGVVGMYGRKITPNLREGTPQHLYLPGPHRGVFNMQALQASKEVILCEALIDALTFWCAGYRNVTSSYGVEGFTKDIFDALKAHGVQKVLIAYDRDEAGERAAGTLTPELAAAGMSVFRVVFPRHMDANEYALKVQPAAKSLGTAVRSAKWMAGSRPVAVPAALESAAAIAASADDDAPTEQAVAERDEPVAEPEAIPSLAAEAAASVTSTSPVPSAQSVVETGDDEVTLRLGLLQWRVRGLSKNSSLSTIKVSVRVMLESVFFQDVLDVLSSRARAAFIRQAADELGIEERVLKADLGNVILQLEAMLEAQLREKLQPEKRGYQMSEMEREEALQLLRDPKLLDRVLADFDRCGVVGEETNKLALYLAAVSRKLEAPLAVVIQSSSAAGKSSLMDAVLRFVPEERAGQLLGDDGAVALLYGWDGSAAQGARDRGRARRAECGVCAQALAELGRADDREYGQGPGDGAPRDARVPGAGAGDGDADDDEHRCGRRAAQPLHGADGG